MVVMERILTFVALAAAALAAAALAPDVAWAQGAVRIRLGTLAPQGSSYHRILQEMGEKWKAATNGQVQLTIYAGTMGSELELVRRMRAGQLQAAAVTAQGLASIDHGVAAIQSIPMIFRSLDELDHVKAKLGPVLERRLEAKDFKVLFWADAGWVRFFTRHRVERPEELKRQKTFVTAGETHQFDLMKSAGYSPVALEWADALTALQTKMIDAVPTIPYFALATQVYTVAGYMLDLTWAPVVGALIINKKTWDALSPAARAAMSAAAIETGKQFQAQGRKEADEAVAAMQKRGLTVVVTPPSLLTEWRTASEQLYPRIRGGLVPADMFDEVLRIMTEYRARPGPR
jgi:TRAP-type C4-dicarboxylate transport system substrate-binding protein